MADDEEVIITCSILLSSSIGAALTISGNNNRKHKTWVNEYVAKRNKLGTFNTLLPELSDGPNLLLSFLLIFFCSSLAFTVGSHSVYCIYYIFIAKFHVFHVGVVSH